MTNLDLRRVEEVGLNALQTQRQLFYDGWLLRVSPGKARRARSVNAHFGSSLPLPDKIRYCERVYAERHLPVLFRITPFVHPANLDAELAARGYEAFDVTNVQVAGLARPPEVVDADGVDIALPGAAAFADAVALLQDATPDQRDAYYERMINTPQAARALLASADGRAVGVGTAMLEDGIAGIFSMATAPDVRGRGIAGALLSRLLVWAWEHGATHAYLQVDSANRPALSVYRKFGFATAYTYHYRGRPGSE
ncbi:MAG: GNAT family N-acetyltransferase [Burkholderiales bacterium]|nr:GNAT family N-acetyltransferase [Burkholderiales bacterium]